METQNQSLSPKPDKTFYIKTFGCQMNVADTERMSVLLSGMGATPAKDIHDADIVILNGCEVRDKAAAELISLGPVAIPVLRQAVKDPDEPTVAEQARRCLRFLEGSQAGGLPIAARSASRAGGCSRRPSTRSRNVASRAPSRTWRFSAP